MLKSKIATWARQSRWARPVGVAAYRAIDRMSLSARGPKVLVNAVPKAGTHLLMGVFDHVPHYRFAGRLLWVTEIDERQDGCSAAAQRVGRTFDQTGSSRYIMGHVMHHPLVSIELSRRSIPVVTMVRDPRAIAASAVRYFEENKLRRHDLGEGRFNSRVELAQWLIDGQGELGTPNTIPPLAVRCRQYLGWLEDPNCLIVRFEDLIGEQGGATQDRQLEVIQSILAFTGLEDRVSATAVAGDLYSSTSHTFSVGKIRTWETVLTPDQIAQVEDETKDFMNLLDYRV